MYAISNYYRWDEKCFTFTYKIQLTWKYLDSILCSHFIGRSTTPPHSANDCLIMIINNEERGKITATTTKLSAFNKKKRADCRKQKAK